MSFEPLWQSEGIVIVHALAALLAVILGAVQFALPKGTSVHRGLGRAWVTVMALVALSSFGIYHSRMFGLFSPIHLLSLFTLYTLWEAISAARANEIDKHKRGMIVLYVLALLLAGAFTLLPGRVFHHIVFGQ